MRFRRKSARNRPDVENILYPVFQQAPFTGDARAEKDIPLRRLCGGAFAHDDPFRVCPAACGGSAYTRPDLPFAQRVRQKFRPLPLQKTAPPLCREKSDGARGLQPPCGGKPLRKARGRSRHPAERDPRRKILLLAGGTRTAQSGIRIYGQDGAFRGKVRLSEKPVFSARSVRARPQKAGNDPRSRGRRRGRGRFAEKGERTRGGRERAFRAAVRPRAVL